MEHTSNNINKYEDLIENYFSNYDYFTKKIIFKFDTGHGGIGDFCKFFMILLELCIINNIKMYYLLSNNNLDKFIKIKREKMYLTSKDINKVIYINNYTEIQNIKENFDYIVFPYNLYEIDNNINNKIINYIDKVLYFSDEVKMNSQPFLNKNEEYISIHLRLGDKYLETDVNFIHEPNRTDERKYCEDALFDFIEKNNDKNIYIFCDNNKYKLNLKNKYNFIEITDFEIGHNAVLNVTRKQILDSVSEFYILTNSKHIYAASKSGFSAMASKFKNVPLTEIKKQPLFIPIGANCCTAILLRKMLNLSVLSLPFDYIRCTFECVIENISNNFLHFLPKANEDLIDLNEKNKYINDEYDHFNNENITPFFFKDHSFWHHNLKDKSVIESFNRKINRFYQLLKSDQEIIFCRIIGAKTIKEEIDIRTTFFETLQTFDNDKINLKFKLLFLTYKIGTNNTINYNYLNNNSSIIIVEIEKIENDLLMNSYKEALLFVKEYGCMKDDYIFNFNTKTLIKHTNDVDYNVLNLGYTDIHNV